MKIKVSVSVFDQRSAHSVLKMKSVRALEIPFDTFLKCLQLILRLSDVGIQTHGFAVTKQKDVAVSFHVRMRKSDPLYPAMSWYRVVDVSPA